MYLMLKMSNEVFKEYSSELSEIEMIEEKIGYKFKDKSLLYRAMTHKSFPPILRLRYGIDLEDCEKLEFLGDSVLSFCLSTMIFKRKDCDTEKHATAARAALSSNEYLFEISKRLELDKAILKHPLAQNIEKSMADAVEALIGAIYEDSGIGPVKAFIGRMFKDELNQKMNELIKKNYRQYFNEMYPDIIQEFNETIIDGKLFHEVKLIDKTGQVLSSAVGESKKMAATKAAKNIIQNESN